MINKVKKGLRVENLAKVELIKAGWLVEKKPRTKFQSPDFYGLFDLLAIRKGEVLLVQVKSQPSHFYKARKETRKWLLDTGIMIPCEVWLYLGNNEWRREGIK